MSEQSKAPWWAGKDFNNCWYCKHRINAGHNISGTAHYCKKELSVCDGEGGDCSGYEADSESIEWYKTRSSDALKAADKERIAELERQREKLLEALEILLGDSEDSDYMSAYEQRQKARAAIAEVRGEK